MRLTFAKNFAQFADSFGKEITDNNLIQTFTLLLQDNEFEVKLAAINNISECLTYISSEKICNLMLPTLQNVYPDGTSQFRAGTATALSEMASYVGKDYTIQKILPILLDLIKDENSEVKLNVVTGINKISKVVGIDNLQTFIATLGNMTKDGQWRVRMVVFELLANLGVEFGKKVF